MPNLRKEVKDERRASSYDMLRMYERGLRKMPRADYYQKHKKDLLEKQKKNRAVKKENVQKALAELERLEKLEQSRLDAQNLESETVKKIVRAQIKEDTEDSEKIEGASPWQ